MPLIPYSEWKRPTDAEYAFELRPFVGGVSRTRSDIRDVAREALTADAAARFEARVKRWTGPENERAGERPYQTQQLWFEEEPWRERFTRADAERWLEGTVSVLRGPGGRVDYVMRDHHMVDVALYHHVTTGERPRGLFHADRHSDWAKDRFLEARHPDQAATWWALLPGLKVAGGAESWLPETAVHFATAHVPATEEGTRDIGAHKLVPPWLDPDAVGWEAALEREGAVDSDWVSIDLDYFQPAPQLRLTAGLIRDARFGEMMARARVRVFVLSPQFIRGGDRIQRWEALGSLASSVRLLNLLR